MKEYFSIDKTKGEIITKIRLDREAQAIYELPVIATDGGGRSCFTTVKIKVGDINDNSPEFYLREYKTSIYGNLSVNATFLNVSMVYAGVAAPSVDYCFLSSFLIFIFGRFGACARVRCHSFGWKREALYLF